MKKPIHNCLFMYFFRSKYPHMRLKNLVLHCGSKWPLPPSLGSGNSKRGSCDVLCCAAGAVMVKGQFSICIQAKSTHPCPSLPGVNVP